MTGKYGLVIDNVISITTVLADGTIVKSSKEQHSELFWGLLGAGQNFGVSTEFVFQAFPQDELWVGMMIFPPVPEIVKGLVNNLNELYQVKETPNGPEAKAKGRCGSLLALAKPPPAGGQTMILLLSAFNGTEAEGKEVFKPFLYLGPVENTMAMQPYPKVNALVPTIQGMRSSMKGAAYLAQQRVIVDFKAGDIIRARVRGSQQYDVQHRDGRWTCSCPSRRPCSHIHATELVTHP